MTPGDDISQFDRVCEVQSDKATVEITSRYDGKVIKLNGEVGDMLAVGSSLLELEVEGKGEHVEVSTATEEDAQLTVPHAEPSRMSGGHGARSSGQTTGKVLTTPAVRKLAKENGIDLEEVQGTGAKGRVLKEDVLKLLGREVLSRPSQTEPEVIPVFTEIARPKAAADRTEPIRGYSRLMVQSMNRSLTIPHFGYNDTMEIDGLADLRASLKPMAESAGIKLSYMPFMIKAASLAMLKYPVINSSLNPDQTEITYHASHNIGVAMDTDRGLVVPNIKDCQHKTIFEIAQDLNRLIEAGKSGGIATADLEGTTFSLSNIGAIGGTYMSPVITPPQVAIGAIGRIQTVPRFDGDGDVVAKQIMEVSWAGDHRVIDGATMARFSNAWKAMLEEPGMFLAEMR